MERAVLTAGKTATLAKDRSAIFLRERTSEGINIKESIVRVRFSTELTVLLRVESRRTRVGEFEADLAGEDAGEFEEDLDVALRCKPEGEFCGDLGAVGERVSVSITCDSRTCKDIFSVTSTLSY